MPSSNFRLRTGMVHVEPAYTECPSSFTGMELVEALMPRCQGKAPAVLLPAQLPHVQEPHWPSSQMLNGRGGSSSTVSIGTGPCSRTHWRSSSTVMRGMLCVLLKARHSSRRIISPSSRISSPMADTVVFPARRHRS